MWPPFTHVVTAIDLHPLCGSSVVSVVSLNISVSGLLRFYPGGQLWFHDVLLINCLLFLKHRLRLDVQIDNHLPLGDLWPSTFAFGSCQCLHRRIQVSMVEQTSSWGEDAIEVDTQMEQMAKTKRLSSTAGALCYSFHCFWLRVLTHCDLTAKTTRFLLSSVRSSCSDLYMQYMCVYSATLWHENCGPTLFTDMRMCRKQNASRCWRAVCGTPPTPIRIWATAFRFL